MMKQIINLWLQLFGFILTDSAVILYNFSENIINLATFVKDIILSIIE